MKASRIINRAILGVLALGLGVSFGQTASELAEAVSVSKPAVPSTPADKPSVDDSRLSRLLKEASLSAGVSEVVKLAESGTNVSVLTAHVRNADHAYRLRPEDVAHLRQHEVPDAVITAMIERGAELRAQRLPLSPFPANASIVASVPSRVATIVPAVRSSEPESTLVVIGSSGLKQGLSYRNYYYSPRNYFASRPYGGRYASFGHYARPYDPGPGCYAGHGRRACR
ncbi:MAG: hypothetical protein MUE94_04570 [Verrucomicrobia bacterium]|jgi:hypothetical protein|nr:hypothetical protein [Verrucomicrobiota bacterium]